MGQVSSYSMLNVSATVDGRQIIGFFDGDNAVTVAQGVDVGQLLVGADGSSIFSQTADKSAQITIRLQHTSPTHAQLHEKWKAQRSGRVVGFPFDFVDSQSNEGGNADKCFIMKAPDDSKGQNASVREWVLITGEWNPTIPSPVTA